MLLLDTKTMEFDGIQIFPDHADPLQFYYLPLAPHLTTRDDGAGGAVPAFSLLRFKGQAGTGGFINFDVNLGLPPARAAQLASAVQRMADLRDPPRIAPVPVVDGSVRLIMLDAETPVEGGHDDAAPAPAPGTLRFVEKIRHAAKPSLYGDNQAAFSVQLTQEGVTTVLQALDGEILPIAVVYSLEYLGLRPAYHVKLEIDWERVQKHMDESFGANVLFFSTEINKAVDDLREKRAIEFEADSFVDDSDPTSASITARRDAAIAQVRAMITDAFFQPSLPPWKNDGKEWSDDLKKAADVMALIAGGPAAAQTSKAMFSYKKTEYQRTDRKSLNVDFSERTTVRRTIFPQGHLAGLFEVLKDLDRAHFVKDVDLDDPWFKRRKLAVFAQADFEGDKIGSINVRARYNGEPKNAILTKNTPTASFEWAGHLDGNTLSMPVELSTEVLFTGVDATERPRLLTSAVEIEEGEQRAIDPRANYAISPVPVVASIFPFDRYPMVEVHLKYEDAANHLAEGELIRLTADKQQDVWPVFVLDTSKRDFSYKTIVRGANHVDHESEWTTTDEEQVTVVAPFPQNEVMVTVALDWTRFSRAFVDLVYRDPGIGDEQRKSIEFIAGDARKSVFFEMADPSRHLIEYSVLLLGVDGSSQAVPPSQTTGLTIAVSADMIGRRIVEVRPPVDFAAQRLAKVTVDLAFEDLIASKTAKANLIFEPGATAKTFEYPVVNTDRAKYSSKIAYLFDNGMSRTVEIKESEEPVIQLKAPQ